MKAGNFVQDHPVPIAAAVLVLLSAGALAIGVPLGRITEVAIYLLYGAGVNLLVGYTGLVPFGASVLSEQLATKKSSFLEHRLEQLLRLSSTARLHGLPTESSGIPDHPLSRVMTVGGCN